jgi:uncharacterized protein YegJ (DUF2314 family)
MIRALVLWFLLAGAPEVAGDPKPEFSGDPVLRFRRDDPEMTEAIVRARASLPAFLDALQAGGADGYAVKVFFDTVDGHGEYIWVGNVTLSDGQLLGVLFNEPNGVPGLHRGDQVLVRMFDVADWIIFDRGEKLGGFTHAVMERRR